MGKLTFRADDDLLARVEELDASKSEVMREALRAYLGETTVRPERDREETIDDLLSRRLDELIEDKLASTPPARDVNADISAEGVSGHAEMSDAASGVAADPDGSAPSDDGAHPPSDASDTTTQCTQCGESVDSEYVYCPNCGEKRSRRVFCECGDEIRTDWSFCPGCGRRTPAADVLDNA